MSTNNVTQNLKSTSSEALDWAVIQKDMKNKLGSDIYESWLRKINFVEEFQSKLFILNKIFFKLIILYLDLIKFIICKSHTHRF